MFIGDWKLNNMDEGDLYEMQQDGNYDMYSVKYVRDRKVKPDNQEI